MEIFILAEIQGQEIVHVRHYCAFATHSRETALQSQDARVGSISEAKRTGAKGIDKSPMATVAVRGQSSRIERGQEASLYSGACRTLLSKRLVEEFYSAGIRLFPPKGTYLRVNILMFSRPLLNISECILIGILYF
jgi:hypothetical protein